MNNSIPTALHVEYNQNYHKRVIHWKGRSRPIKKFPFSNSLVLQVISTPT
jgi:hypothetical protein